MIIIKSLTENVKCFFALLKKNRKFAFSVVNFLSIEYSENCNERLLLTNEQLIFDNIREKKYGR